MSNRYRVHEVYAQSINTDSKTLKTVKERIYLYSIYIIYIFFFKKKDGGRGGETL